MSRLKLPQISLAAKNRLPKIEWELPVRAKAQWTGASVHASGSDSPATISIYSEIGRDQYEYNGMWNAKTLAGALRDIGNKDVHVSINSPGGDVFEGIAMYNLLVNHPAAVYVEVVGIAASAAAVIAMAGDEIVMDRGSVMMVHNTWGFVAGNRHDFQSAAETFKTFDAALVEIFAARTKQSAKQISSMLDGEGASDGTYMSAAQAIALGFATKMSSKATGSGEEDEDDDVKAEDDEDDDDDVKASADEDEDDDEDVKSEFYEDEDEDDDDDDAVKAESDEDEDKEARSKKKKTAAKQLPIAVAAKRQIESALAKAGVPRRERHKLISSLAGPRDANPPKKEARNRDGTRKKGVRDTALVKELSGLLASISRK